MSSNQQEDPMPSRAEVPEWARDLARVAALSACVFEDVDPDYVDLMADAAVEATLPALHAHWVERLLSKEAVYAAVQIRIDALKAAGHEPSDEFRENYALTVREHLEAALQAISSPEGGDS